MTPVRISLLTEIPAPFRIPLFNALAGREDVDLSVLFLSERDPKRLHYALHEGELAYRRRVLSGWELVHGSRWIVFSRGVVAALRQHRPDLVVVGGWNQPAFWLAALYARATRTPLVAWVESTARDERPGSGPLELAKRGLIRSCSGFLVPGVASRTYLRDLGVDDALIVTAPNAVDSDIFSTEVELARDDPSLRERLGLEGCVVLYVGRLDPEKGVDVLLEAVRALPLTLAIIGAGSRDAELRRQAPPNVRFMGALPRERLTEWYAAADIFVLPSRSEQWGMVLNEAAEAGLPLVATEAAGAAHDLIEQGVNGARVPVGDAVALEAALARLTSDPRLRATAGARSRELVASHTPEVWAEAVSALAARLSGGSL